MFAASSLEFERVPIISATLSTLDAVHTRGQAKLLVPRDYPGHAMGPFPAAMRASSAVALLALSACYYPYGYYPYGYYPVVPAYATQREVPVQSYGLANGADAQNIPPASQGGAAYVYPAPMYVVPAYYPAYYPVYAPWYGWPGWWAPSVSFGFGYWGRW